MGAIWDRADASGDADYSGIARRQLSLSRARRQVFGPIADSESGWSIALALYTSPEKDLTPTQLVKAAQIPPTTVLRRLAELERAGFIDRRCDRKDKRLVRVRLTAAGRSAISSVFATAAAVAA
jgi:DNA-binding MarR family transcriptional regulator